jgi:hypothetical protein
MTQASAPSNAFDQARIAYELMAKRKRQLAAVRRSRERARNVRRALASCAVVALFIGLAIYQGWHSVLLGSPAPPHETTADRFAGARTGLVRTPVRGETCRELQFDNASGRFIGGSIGPCDDVAVNEQAATSQQNRRLDAFRGVFAR